jgi:hypothetical protein
MEARWIVLLGALLACCGTATLSDAAVARPRAAAPVCEPAPPPAPWRDPAGQRRRRKADPPAARALEPFVGELDATQKAARERNAPVLVLLALEGEEASDRFRDHMLASTELAAASQDALVVLANNGLHELETIEVEGADGAPIEVRRCKAYRTPTCTDHQRAWDEIYAAFYPEQDMYTPAVVVVSPTGEVLNRRPRESAAWLAAPANRRHHSSCCRETQTRSRRRSHRRAGWPADRSRNAPLRLER